jgi:hypothetical protein
MPQYVVGVSAGTALASREKKNKFFEIQPTFC